MTAREPDYNEPIIWTKDEQDVEEPMKPFPSQYPFLENWYWVLDHLEGYSYVAMADKCRQMLLTTSSVLYAHHDCMMHYNRFWLLSKTKKGEAEQILQDKVRFPWLQMPEWVQNEFPIAMKPKFRVDYLKTGSTFMAVGENVASAEARGNTANVIVDEAARQATFGDILQACLPMRTKVICITTAEYGSPGAELYQELLERDA
jgi:hypothetical protein